MWGESVSSYVVSIWGLLVYTCAVRGKADLTAASAQDAADQPVGNPQEHADEALY